MMKEGDLDGIFMATARYIRSLPTAAVGDFLIVFVSVLHQYVSGVLASLVAILRAWPLCCAVVLSVFVLYTGQKYGNNFELAKQQTIQRLFEMRKPVGCIGNTSMTYPRNLLEDLVDEEHKRQSKLSWWEYHNTDAAELVVAREIRKRSAGTKADVIDDYLEEQAEVFRNLPWWQKLFAGE